METFRCSGPLRRRLRADDAWFAAGGLPHVASRGVYGESGGYGRIRGMLVRHANPAWDARACAAIYEPFVCDTPVSFEEHPPSEAEIARRIAAISQRYPWLVADVAGRGRRLRLRLRPPRPRGLTVGPPMLRSTWGRRGAVRGWDVPSTAG